MCACDCKSVLHVHIKSTRVRVQVWVVCSCMCVEGRRGGEYNTRWLKSVGLTACHKTVWLIESPGMSSLAVLMNPKPKGLMKHAPLAKTVP